MVYMQDPRVIMVILGIIIVAAVVAIIKKAAKIMGILLLCGMAVATVRPATTQLMIDNGVSIQGSVLTIQTNDETHAIDLAMGTSFDATEQENGDYLITLSVPNQDAQTFTVSKETAAWTRFGMAVIIEIEQLGEELAHKYL